MFTTMSKKFKKKLNNEHCKSNWYHSQSSMVDNLQKIEHSHNKSKHKKGR